MLHEVPADRGEGGDLTPGASRLVAGHVWLVGQSGIMDRPEADRPTRAGCAARMTACAAGNPVQATPLPACAAGTAGNLCGPLSMPIGMQVTPGLASGITNGHDVQADHRDSGENGTETAGAARTKQRRRARRGHRARRGRGVDHLSLPRIEGDEIDEGATMSKPTP